MSNRKYTLAVACLMGITMTLVVGCSKSGHKDHEDHDHDHGNHHSSTSGSGEATEAQIAAYPTDICVVSDEALDDHGAPINHMHEGRFVRFCCKSCVKDFNKDPQQYLTRLDKAATAD